MAQDLCHLIWDPKMMQCNSSSKIQHHSKFTSAIGMTESWFTSQKKQEIYPFSKVKLTCAHTASHLMDNEVSFPQDK
jgi:hypothetical protein